MIRATQKLKRLSFVFFLSARICVPVAAQTATTAPQSSQNQSSSPTPASPVAENKQGVAQPAYLTPTAGYQGELAETIAVVTIASQAVDDKFKPASSVNLAMAPLALQTLVLVQKYVTGIWYVGPIDKATG